MARLCLVALAWVEQLPTRAITKVFTITKGLVKANLVIVTSKIFFLSTLIYILIDSGATYYFIAKSLVARLEV